MPWKSLAILVQEKLLHRGTESISKLEPTSWQKGVKRFQVSVGFFIGNVQTSAFIYLRNTKLTDNLYTRETRMLAISSGMGDLKFCNGVHLIRYIRSYIMPVSEPTRTNTRYGPHENCPYIYIWICIYVCLCVCKCICISYFKSRIQIKTFIDNKSVV